MNESMNKFLPPEFAEKLCNAAQQKSKQESIQSITDGIDLVSTIAKNKDNLAGCVMTAAAAVAYLKLIFVDMNALSAEEFDDRFNASVAVSLKFMEIHNK